MEIGTFRLGRALGFPYCVWAGMLDLRMGERSENRIWLPRGAFGWNESLSMAS